ncbi:phosphatidylinositol-binding protein scs2 [Phlyctochytrium planicorne]|nr:phosphatidylinositol-binding protein scs2 [Phlyctochytrium planicorne]
METTLSLSPSHDLEFRRPFNNVVRQTLTVTNSHPTEPLAFKVKTTAPKQYCVRPNSGRIPPQSSTEVQVLLQAMKEDPPLDFKCKDKFLVQAIKIQNSDGDDLQELWSRAENLKKVDPEAAKELICEKKLRCVFLPAGADVGSAAEVAAPSPSVTPADPRQARSVNGAASKEGPSQDADRELRDAKETIKRLTAACEGYKSEIERLNLLRQRRGAGGNASESSASDSKGSSSAFAAQKGGIPPNAVFLIALIAFLLGAYFL